MLLKSTVLSSGRKSAGAVPGRKNEYGSTSLSLRERLNRVTFTSVAGLGLRGASPESDRLSPAFFFFLLLDGSEMALSSPNRSLPRSPVPSSALISVGSVGSNMQKMTELLAPFTALTTVSIDTRFLLGSGEKNTRTLALPTFTGFDQAAPLAVLAMVGFCAIRAWRSA